MKLPTCALPRCHVLVLFLFTGTTHIVMWDWISAVCADAAVGGGLCRLVQHGLNRLCCCCWLGVMKGESAVGDDTCRRLPTRELCLKNETQCCWCDVVVVVVFVGAEFTAYSVVGIQLRYWSFGLVVIVLLPLLLCIYRCSGT